MFLTLHWLVLYSSRLNWKAVVALWVKRLLGADTYGMESDTNFTTGHSNVFGYI